ncbi:MAG TPA: LLM class F420-dependent oxidoreductase [Dehalococcoidia bacterium]|nr:LLM class F420-dependent oxidoreductase [Dehalococcoidia bacterium]
MAEQQRWGFSLPLEGLSLAEQRTAIQEAERIGYTDAWSLEVDGIDCFTPLAATAAWSEGLTVGTAIANVYTRTPSVLAMQAAALSELAPGRVVLGIGSSSPAIVDDWGGLPFSDPYRQVRDATKILRGLLAGERLSFESGRFRVRNFRLSRPPAQSVPIYIAALREGMLRLAGRLGDGAIINWLSAEDVKKVVPIAKAAAKEAGKDPARFEIGCRIFVCVTDDAAYTRQQAKRLITTYLTTPVYAAFHEWLGRGPALRPMLDAWAAGDRRGALAAVSDALLDELVLVGSAAACRERVQQYVDAGVTIPILYFAPFAPSGTPGEQSLRALQELRP